MKHQIAIFKSEIGTEKTSEYLEQMEREIKVFEAQNKTGNKVLDAVLMSKSVYCQKHGIEMKIMVDGGLLDLWMWLMSVRCLGTCWIML